MVNAWSLAYDVLNGTMDETFPIKKKEDGMSKEELKFCVDAENVVNVPSGDINLDEDININTNTEFQYSDAFDHMMETDSSDGYPSSFTTFSDNDDQVAHHFADSLSINTEGQNLKEIMSDSRNKYHENEILKDVEEYVSRTYNGHYTGTKHEYRNVQTIDLMASRDLASDFCQANILKYGSRYGSKDGRNKKDLLKVIHYAMLLLHFDEHYGKPSMTSGNIDHNMP
tara:strand:+ start:101 stop:781 length:681 start_codon:yes stop_codon:yes gene_type:complete